MDVQFKNSKLWAKREFIWKSSFNCVLHVLLFLLITGIFLLLFFTFSHFGQYSELFIVGDQATREDEQQARFTAGYCRMALNYLHDVAVPEGSIPIVSPVSVLLSTLMLLDSSGDESAFRALLNKTGWRSLSREDIHKNVQDIMSKYSGQGALDIKTAIFLNKAKQMELQHIQTLKEVYKTDIVGSVFEDTNDTNARVQKWLKGNLKPLAGFNQFDSDVAVLASSVNLEGQWEFPFSPGDTFQDDFYVTSARRESVVMMHQTNEFGYGELDGFQVLRLPYKGNDLNLYVLMPREVTSLKCFRTKLLTNVRKYIINIDDYLRNTKLDVCLPKMKLEWSGSLRPFLSTEPSMGNLLHQSGDSAGRPSVYDVLMQAELSVDEAGTRGSSVTFNRMTDRQSSQVFCANRPFVFFVKDVVQKALFFLGQYGGNRS